MRVRSCCGRCGNNWWWWWWWWWAESRICIRIWSCHRSCLQSMSRWSSTHCQCSDTWSRLLPWRSPRRWRPLASKSRNIRSSLRQNRRSSTSRFIWKVSKIVKRIKLHCWSERKTVPPYQNWTCTIFRDPFRTDPVQSNPGAHNLHPVSGADSMGHGGGTCPPLLRMAGHGGTASRRTANKKLTKLYWPSQKRSPKQLIVLLEPKSGGVWPRKLFPALGAGSLLPFPLSLRTGAPLPLLNSFRPWP